MAALNRRWLWVVRISTFCIFVALLVCIAPSDVSLITHYDPQDSSESRLRWAILPSLLWFPYFWVFWRVRDITDASRVKKALAHGVAWGSVGGALCLSIAVSILHDKDWLSFSLASIFSLVFVALIGGAIKTYYSMERDRRDIFVLGARFAVMAVIPTVLAVAIPSSMFIVMQKNEGSAASALRTIHAAQIQYAKIHPDKGFASSLSELGPAPGAALIDKGLANGQKYIYEITLIPASPKESGPLVGYALIARPHPYGSSGRRSFYSDESGVIRYTAADRAATGRDRVLP